MIVQPKRRYQRHRALSPRRKYVVIGIEADYLRILDDSGQPCLYPPILFKVNDRTPGPDWVLEKGEEGEKYAYPPALGKPGFSQDYFDGKAAAVAIFWQIINQRLASAG